MNSKHCVPQRKLYSKSCSGVVSEFLLFYFFGFSLKCNLPVFQCGKCNCKSATACKTTFVELIFLQFLLLFFTSAAVCSSGRRQRAYWPLFHICSFFFSPVFSPHKENSCLILYMLGYSEKFRRSRRRKSNARITIHV